jgi:hypothetical protein
MPQALTFRILAIRIRDRELSLWGQENVPVPSSVRSADRQTFVQGKQRGMLYNTMHDLECSLFENPLQLLALCKRPWQP